MLRKYPKHIKLECLKYAACIFIGLFSSTAFAENHSTNRSTYTSIKHKDCANISSEEDGQLYQVRCPAHAGYDLDVIGADVRYGLDITWKQKVVRHQPIMPFHVGDKVEWRYRISQGAPEFYALIYRLYTAQFDGQDFLPRENDKQDLVVVRLNQEKSCIIGIITQGKQMNTEARQRADDLSAPCLKTD